MGHYGEHDHPAGLSVDESVTAGPSAAVVLSPAVINQLGVRTSRVHRGTLERHIETFGFFYPDTQGYYQSNQGFPRSVPAEEPNQPSSARTVVFGQVYERHALAVRSGLNALVSVPALGAKVWKGTVGFVEPRVNQSTRTLNFRIVMDSEAAFIKAGMVARVTLEVDPIQDALLVPRDAVIATSGSKRVIVALGSGRFEPREVVSEDVGEDEVIIRSGLNEGDEVVVSGQFLLDSEASLQAGLRRLADERQAAQAGEAAK
jgi:multidrug efflux pump subunit AcrA (membrane-fusion protein)